MKKIMTITLVAILLAACGNKEQQLKKRAAELCKYIPDHKKDCIRHIAINRKEQALRNAMSDYLVKEIGVH